MASPVALTIESANTSDRAALGSSLGSQRSYGTVKEASSAVLTASGRLSGFTEHLVDERDTLQGLALRYGVTVSVCVCVCVRERERERKTRGNGER